VRLITLTSDFGVHDPYVGIMKSRIVLRAPQIPVIDLTHQITPFAPEEAGYWLYCCYPQFPPGTTHVAVVDPGVGSARAIVVLSAAEQYFVAPDNGLLGLVAASCTDAAAYRVEADGLEGLQLPARSATFHGRDVMGPLAAELAAGRVSPEQLGPRHELHPGRLRPATRASDGSVRGSVAVIDHYGNALTTIPAAALGALRRVQLQPGGRSLRLVRTYAEAEPGECVALINSASMLELCARQASAAVVLNVRAGQEVYVS
jgi:hypothetical protein